MYFMLLLKQSFGKKNQNNGSLFINLNINLLYTIGNLVTMLFCFPPSILSKEPLFSESFVKYDFSHKIT